MYADLSRMMMPANLRDAMVEQGRRNLAFQKELLSWQMAQVQTAEEQVVELWKRSMDSTRQAFDRAAELQDKALASLAPAPTEEA